MGEEIEEERQRQHQARQDDVRPRPSNANGHVIPGKYKRQRAKFERPLNVFRPAVPSTTGSDQTVRMYRLITYFSWGHV